MTYVEVQITPPPDPLPKPAHYAKLRMDPLAFIEANKLDFLEGNVIKYVARYRHKNGVEDLLKAQAYLGRLIAREDAKRRGET